MGDKDQKVDESQETDGSQTPEERPSAADSERARGNSRRRFLKGTTPVLLTLASRSALGLECTGSLLASWNTSAHPDIVNCKFACSPGYWKTDNNGVNHTICEWDNYIPSSYSRSTLFKSVFNSGDELLYPSLPQNPTSNPVLDPFPGQTLEQVVNTASSGLLPTAGFQAVAALLNAAHPYINIAYPYTISGVISDFITAYRSYMQAEMRHQNGSFALSAFNNKYDIYTDPNVACPLPHGVCVPGQNS